MNESVRQQGDGSDEKDSVLPSAQWMSSLTICEHALVHVGLLKAGEQASMELLSELLDDSDVHSIEWEIRDLMYYLLDREQVSAVLESYRAQNNLHALREALVFSEDPRTQLVHWQKTMSPTDVRVLAMKKIMDLVAVALMTKNDDEFFEHVEHILNEVEDLSGHVENLQTILGEFEVPDYVRAA